MNRTKKLTLTLMTFFSTSIPLSQSVNAACSLPSGWYAEANFGVSKINGISFPGVASFKRTTKGGSAFGGYKFTPYVGIEAGYSYYGYLRLKNSQNTTEGRYYPYAYVLTSRLTFPVSTTGLELFAKLGVSLINSQTRSINTTALAVDGASLSGNGQSSFGAYWGGGAQYYINSNLAVNIQYATAQGNSSTGSASLLTGGLSILMQ